MDLEAITIEEIKSLDCFTYEKQSELWNSIISNVNKKNLTELLSRLGYDLVNFRHLNESNGIVNKIYLVNARDKHTFINKDLILKILSPDSRYFKHKGHEAVLMNYIEQNTNIPVPKVIDYSYEPSRNVFKCNYILMEKIEGKLLLEVLPKKSSQIPDSIIDEMIEVVKQLRSLTNTYQATINSSKLIGCFDIDLKLIPIYPTHKLYDNYLEFFNDNLKYSIKQFHKIKRLESLGKDLEKKLNDLNQRVRNRPELNNLKFDNFLWISHNDLNPTNIIVDPDTFKLNGIIDWEWSQYSYDIIEFHEEWLADKEEQNLLDNRIRTRLEKELPGVYNESNARRLIKYLYWIYMLAYLTVNYQAFEIKQTNKKKSTHSLIVETIINNSRLLEKELERWDLVLNEFC